jgi:hypothetical protein
MVQELGGHEQMLLKYPFLDEMMLPDDPVYKRLVEGSMDMSTLLLQVINTLILNKSLIISVHYLA